MSNNSKKNIVLSIASGVLFLALLDGWEYGFFTLLRFIVTAATSYVAWMSFNEMKENWVWGFGFVAVLFNPIFPIYLERSTWVVIDFIIGIALLAAIFIVKLNKETPQADK